MKITAHIYDRHITIERDFGDDITVPELVKDFISLMVGMSFSEATAEDGILEIAEEIQLKRNENLNKPLFNEQGEVFEQHTEEEEEDGD